jgi:flagellin-like protein
VNSQGGKEPKMRKLLKSRKALSPVVAAIILIAVTVAVSIAVAAWMGSLTIGFMDTKELKITEVTYETNGNITITLTNPGTADVTIGTVKVNDVTLSFTSTDLTLDAGESGTDLTIDMASTWVAGNKYSIALFATDGTLIGSYTDTA